MRKLRAEEKGVIWDSAYAICTVHLHVCVLRYFTYQSLRSLPNERLRQSAGSSHSLTSLAASVRKHINHWILISPTVHHTVYSSLHYSSTAGLLYHVLLITISVFCHNLYFTGFTLYLSSPLRLSTAFSLVPGHLNLRGQIYI
jgi:hypothetical protein